MNGEELKVSAGAIEAGAKLGIELIKTTRDFARFCANLTGLTDDSIIGLINDKIQFFRYKRQLRIAEQYNKKSVKQGYEPLPPKFLIPVIENASLEEEDNLQDLWINLLVNWTNREKKDSRKMAYVDILKKLSSRDIYFLNEIYGDVQNSNSMVTFFAEGRNPVTKKSYDDINVRNNYYKEGLFFYEYCESIDNLIRLGCVRESNETEEKRRILNLTYLGAGLVEACMVNTK